MTTPGSAAPGARHRARSTRAPGAAGLAARQLRADPWVTVLVALVVLLVTVVATAWPRVVGEMNSRQISHVLSPLSPQQRDLVAVASHTSVHLPLGPPLTEEQVWGGQKATLEELRSEQPEPLRSALRPGHFYSQVETVYAADAPSTGYAAVDVSLRADPFLSDHVRLVEGEWPTPCTPLNEEYYRFDPEAVPDRGECEGTEVLSIMISADAAERLDWPVGETRGMLTLTGVYEPIDPDAAYWQHAPNGATLGEQFDGNIGTTALVAGYLNEANPGTDGNPGTVSEVRFVLPLGTEGFAADSVRDVAGQLRRLTTEPVQFRLPATAAEAPEGGLPVDAPPPMSAQFDAEVIPVFERLADEQRVTAALLAVLAAGPAGLTAAVLALGARLLVTRREPALGLALARGAAPAQLRRLLAAEGALVGLPAAACGYAVARLLVPGPFSWGQVLVAGLVGLAPAAALAATAGTASPVHERRDLRSRSRSRVRWIVEVAVFALAGLAVWRLLDLGLTGERAASAGVDPLLAATPVLVSVAAALLTLRLYPVPVAALARSLKAGRGLTGFLGAARTVRDPAGGLVPALAVVLGVAVAVFSTVLSSTVTVGAETAAWEANGAQIRLSGARADEALVERVEQVDGVAQVARVADAAHTANLSGAVSANGLRVVVVDSALRDVQLAAERLQPLPAELSDSTGPVPVVTGGEVPEGTGPAELSGLGAVEVVGHVETLPGYAAGRSFVVVEATGWERLGGTFPSGNLTMVAVEDSADREQVAAALREAVPASLVETPQQQLQAYRSAPVTSGLGDLSWAAVILTTALTALSIVLVQLLGAPARTRLFAVLRTLGMGSGQGRRLTVWELAPLLAAAFLVGGAVGVAVPWLVLQAVDVRSMTGGSRQPDLALAPISLVAVLGAVLLVLAVTTLVAATIATRADLTRHLRVGEER